MLLFCCVQPSINIAGMSNRMESEALQITSFPPLLAEAMLSGTCCSSQHASVVTASMQHVDKTGCAGLTDKFVSTQLIPASSGFDMDGAAKDKHHLPNIHKETGVPYSEMIFFDDESPNVQKVSGYQPTCHHTCISVSRQFDE